MPDAEGNLFRTRERTDRTYGPGGQLRQAGGVRCVYDAEGNLVRKTLPDGQQWRCAWDGAGQLAEVTQSARPVVVYRLHGGQLPGPAGGGQLRRTAGRGKYVQLHKHLIAIAAVWLDSAAALAQMRHEASALDVSTDKTASYAPAYLEHTMRDLLAQDSIPDLHWLKMPLLALTGGGDTERRHCAAGPAPVTGIGRKPNPSSQAQPLYDNPKKFALAELALLLD